MNEASDRVFRNEAAPWALRNRITDLEAENERLRQLVEGAYAEGWVDGYDAKSEGNSMNDLKNDWGWSSTKKALEADDE